MGENQIKDEFKIALAQLDPTVGDVKGNLDLAIKAIDKSSKTGVSLLVFPEMFLSGYPPEDLLFKPDFLNRITQAVETIKNYVGNMGVIIGAPFKARDNSLYNAAILIHGHDIKGIYCKQALPNYGVFDEKRYFIEGKANCIWECNGLKILPTICEDIWQLDKGPIAKVNSEQIDLIINISASPYHIEKIAERFSVLQRAAKRLQAHLLYVNLLGGQDELVFDGGSMFLSASGAIVKQFPQFQEGVFELESACLARSNGKLASNQLIELPRTKEVFSALVLGLKDYVRKNGFKKVVLGLSGGIDSSVVACIATEALGKENVIGLSMPSRFNSAQTQADVKKLVSNLGIKCYWVPIEEIFQSFLNNLSAIFDGLDFDVTEENIQARIRGTILMALSNKFGFLVITTGNKSEMSVGYCTLYGDMAGGFAVLKDVPKTMVYELAQYFNGLKGSEVIPDTVITRAPSAELRHGQKDEESLLPYSQLDKIIDAYVEKHMPYIEIVKMAESEFGLPEAEVCRIIRLIDKSEYKRRQSPPGVKITPLAFGKDWRMPITNKFRLDDC